MIGFVPRTEPRHRVSRGDEIIEQPLMCTMTRFGLGSSRRLAGFARDFRRLNHAAELADPGSFGLLQSSFLVENPTTCFSWSMWSGTPSFSSHVPQHIDVVRRSMGRLATVDDGPELWSTTWRLVAVSNNLRWDGFDLGRLLSFGGAPEVRP